MTAAGHICIPIRESKERAGGKGDFSGEPGGGDTVNAAVGGRDPPPEGREPGTAKPDARRAFRAWVDCMLLFSARVARPRGLPQGESPRFI
jgi:hypothetical protein